MTQTIQFHYLRDHQHQPIAVVCRMTGESNIDFYGLSICSPNDSFRKDRGREIAMGRARKMSKTWAAKESVAAGPIRHPSARMQLYVAGKHENFRYKRWIATRPVECIPTAAPAGNEVSAK